MIYYQYSAHFNCSIRSFHYSCSLVCNIVDTSYAYAYDFGFWRIANQANLDIFTICSVQLNHLFESGPPVNVCDTKLWVQVENTSKKSGKMSDIFCLFRDIRSKFFLFESGIQFFFYSSFLRYNKLWYSHKKSKNLHFEIKICHSMTFCPALPWKLRPISGQFGSLTYESNSNVDCRIYSFLNIEYDNYQKCSWLTIVVVNCEHLSKDLFYIIICPNEWMWFNFQIVNICWIGEPEIFFISKIWSYL